MISIHNIRDVTPGEYDQTWAIVRFYKGHSGWIRHVPQLSPSHRLWATFHKLQLGGEWNAENFDHIYLPAFLEEMRGEPAREKLNELYRLDKEGKRIALVCFCKDEALCHRSVVAGLLQGVGCNVSLPSGNDYSEYYRRYKQAKGD